MSPNFYQLGQGGQFSPESINRRKDEASGKKPLVPTNKKDIVEALIEKKEREGENVTTAQIRRWEKMEMSSLEKLMGHVSEIEVPEPAVSLSSKASNGKTK